MSSDDELVTVDFSNVSECAEAFFESQSFNGMQEYRAFACSMLDELEKQDETLTAHNYHFISLKCRREFYDIAYNICMQHVKVDIYFKRMSFSDLDENNLRLIVDRWMDIKENQEAVKENYDWVILENALNQFKSSESFHCVDKVYFHFYRRIIQRIVSNIEWKNIKKE